MLSRSRLTQSLTPAQQSTLPEFFFCHGFYYPDDMFMELFGCVLEQLQI
jgi:hypothetical protein